MTCFGESLRLFKASAKSLLLFEAVYKAALICIVMPMEFGLLDLALHVRGLTYLCETDLASFLLFPATWAFALVMALLLAFYSLLEICGLIALLHGGRCGQRLRMRDGFLLGARRAIAVVRRGNRGLIFYVLLLIPFTNVTLVSNAVTSIHLPEFIGDYIEANLPLAAAYAALFVFLCIVAFRLTFSLHAYLLRGGTFHEGAAESRHLLGHRRWWYFLWRFTVWTLLVTVVAMLMTLVVYIVLDLLLLKGSDPHLGATIMGVFDMVFEVVIACLATPLVYAFLTCMYYRLCDDAGIDVPPALELPVWKHRWAVNIAGVLGAFVLADIAMMLGTSHIVADASGVAKALTEGSGACTVTAHRGGSFTAPENTLPAFEYAIDHGADWVELDVQQTRDGVLVVMHDSNLKRTCGIDEDIWNVDWDDIKDLDSGSFFSPDASGTRICTLEEALQTCRGRIHMNIEVKPDGHGTDLERKTVDLIERYDMADQVAVASISYDSLVKVKAYDPSITTMYDMLLAYGDIGDIPDVDIYSVDEAFVTPALVKDVHDDDRQLFAWTVNDEDNMVRMYLYGVDSLVTDRIEQAESICR